MEIVYWMPVWVSFLMAVGKFRSLKTSSSTCFSTSWSLCGEKGELREENGSTSIMGSNDWTCYYSDKTTSFLNR